MGHTSTSPALKQVILDTGKREQSLSFQPEAHIRTLHATDSTLPHSWPSSLPAKHHGEIQAPWSYVFLCFSSFHAGIMQTESLRFTTDCGSSRSMHIHTLLQLAEKFRREELTRIAGEALKKKVVFPSVLSEMMQLKRKESYRAIYLRAIKH